MVLCTSMNEIDLFKKFSQVIWWKVAPGMLAAFSMEAGSLTKRVIELNS